MPHLHPTLREGQKVRRQPRWRTGLRLDEQSSRVQVLSRPLLEHLLQEEPAQLVQPLQEGQEKALEGETGPEEEDPGVPEDVQAREDAPGGERAHAEATGQPESVDWE